MPNNIHELYLNNVKYNYKDKELKIVLNENSMFSITDIYHVIGMHETSSIVIKNISSLHQLETVLRIVRNINFNGNITIDLISSSLIIGLENRSRIDFSALPNNINLIGFKENNEQTEFTTWAHNLSSDKKKILYSVLTTEQQKIFLKQEDLIKHLVNDINNDIPNIMNYNKKEQFNIIFDYIDTKYRYLDNYFYQKGVVKGNKLELKDPIEVYKRGIGNSFGLSNLLLLATNNEQFRINSTIVDGHLGTTPHCWNELIDEDGNITDYDITCEIKDTNDISMQESGYKYDKVYPRIIELKNKKKGKKLKNILNNEK